MGLYHTIVVELIVVLLNEMLSILKITLLQVRVNKVATPTPSMFNIQPPFTYKYARTNN